MPVKKTDAEKKNEELRIESLTYEQAFDELEKIVERMNAPSVPLEELMKLYEQGMAIGAHCEKLLAAFDARLEKVSSATIAKELSAIEDDDDDEPPFEADND